MENISFDKKFIHHDEYIAGIDEVGRGCLFGDVVSACVIMPLDDPIEGVKDSKKLSPKKRVQIFDKIMEKAIAIGISQVGADIIDQINIKQATRLAMKEAVLKTKNQENKFVPADLYLIDAEKIDLDVPQKSIVHGDDLSYSIACASIVAKVFRDNLCIEWGKQFPGYFLENNKGYGTKAHRDAILKMGACQLHRKTFLKKITGSY